MSKRVSRSTVSSSTEGTDVFDELYANLRTEVSLPQQSPLLHLQQHFMYIVESIQLDSINSLTIFNLYRLYLRRVHSMLSQLSCLLYSIDLSL